MLSRKVAGLLLLVGGACVAQTISVTGNLNGVTNPNVGTFGGSTSAPVITVNAQGIVTGVTTASISSTGGGLSGAQYSNVAGNGTTTGIAGGFTACGSSTPCVVFAPPNYANTEGMPFSYSNVGNLSSGNGANYTMPSTVTYIDYRYGIHMQNADAPGRFSTSNYLSWLRDDFIVTAANNIGNSGLVYTSKVAQNINLIALAGGVNQNGNGFNNKGFYDTLDLRLHKHTRGQAINLQTFGMSHAVGDMLGLYSLNFCDGGYQAGSDEGCEAIDAQASQGQLEPSGTVTSTSGNTVTLSFSVGDGFQGEGRYLLDTSSGYTTGTISAIAGGGSTTPVQFTGSGTTWGSTSVSTTSSTAVTQPGSATITVASGSGISTSTVLVISDGLNYEQVLPTAVSGTSVTATFRYAHASGFAVTNGGMAGRYVCLTADTATTSEFNSVSFYSLGSNLHYCLPIIRSTNTNLDVWLSSPAGGFQGYRGRWANSSPKNQYAIYKGAEVTSVMQSQKLSNVLTLEVPTGSLFSGSDTWMLPHYFGVNVNGGLFAAQQMFPRISGGNPSSYWFTSSGILKSTNGNDSLFTITNAAPDTIYVNNSEYPSAINFNGRWDCYLCTPSSSHAPNVYIRNDDSSANPRIFQQYANSGFIYMQADASNDSFTFANFANFTNSVSVNAITGTIKATSLKATTGTRYVCADTNGLLVSSASACSGT